MIICTRKSKQKQKQQQQQQKQLTVSKKLAEVSVVSSICAYIGPLESYNVCRFMYRFFLIVDSLF